MLHADVTITIFNARPGDDRRDVFYPTVIRGVAYYEAMQMNGVTSLTHDEEFWIRIPGDAVIQGDRQYIDAEKYQLLPAADLASYWTIQKGDYVTTDSITEAPEERDIKKFLRETGRKVIQVVSYADNTKRASPIMRHWRIGGA